MKGHAYALSTEFPSYCLAQRFIEIDPRKGFHLGGRPPRPYWSLESSRDRPQILPFPRVVSLSDCGANGRDMSEQ